MNADTYTDRVRELAKNGLLMGESPTTVAQTAVIAHAELGPQSQTLRFSAEPYVDDPAETTRLYPKDVIQGTGRRWHEDPALQADDLRELAVRILAADLCVIYDETEDPGPATPEQSG